LGILAANHGAISGMEGLMYAFTIGLWHVVSQNGLSVLFQSLWRVPVENNIPAWIKLETERGREREARTAGSWYRAISTNIATPAWGYSVINDKHFWGGTYGNWNWGHVVMAGIGLLHQSAQWFPGIYSGPVTATNFVRRIKARFFGGRCRDLLSGL